MSNARSRLPAYGRTPKELLRDPDISAGAKAVYSMIDEVAGHEDITMDRVASWLGSSRRTAKRLVHELRDSGWIEVIEIVKPRIGQQPSEYVANAFPWQHVSPGGDNRGDTGVQQEAPDLRKRSRGGSNRAGGGDTGVHPGGQKKQKAARTPDRGDTGDPPLGVTNETPPTYLRDDETPPPASSTDDDGFRKFWARYPNTRWKGRRAECHAIWKSMSVEDRRDTWRMLGLFLNSKQWDESEPPSPLNWLEGEPAIAYQQGNRPRQKPKMLTAEDVRLPD